MSRPPPQIAAQRVRVAPPISDPQLEFERSIVPHLDPLRALARDMTGCTDLADDALQEALIAYWRCATPPTDPRGWLVRATVHKCLHALRARRRRIAHEESAGAERDERCPLCEPSHRAEDAEMRAELDAAIGALSEELRSVVLLREREELDYAQIAARLSVPIGTVRSRLHRARVDLARRLRA